MSWTAAKFEKLLNTKFHVKNFEEDMFLELIEVAPYKNSIREGGSFTLLFQSKNTQAFEQGTYHIKSDTFDDQLFLVPVLGDDQGVQYEVIFN